MNTNLLFPDKDWMNPETYYDYNSIVQDLSLHIIYRMAARQVFWEKGEVKSISDSDHFIQETFRKVVAVPLVSEEEILYRQSIIKDCLGNEDFIREIYHKSEDILRKWDLLGRKENKRGSGKSNVGQLVNDIHVLNLFVTGLSEIKEILVRHKDSFKSEGLKNLCERMVEEYSEEKEANYKKVLQDISFYVDNNVSEEEKKTTSLEMIKLPKIVMECGIAEGLKLGDIKLQSVETVEKKYRDPNSTISKVQGFLNSRIPDSISFNQDSPMRQQLSDTEYEVVRYVAADLNDILLQFRNFFDQLKFQTAFYCGAVNLKHHMLRFELEYCFPQVGKQEDLCFEELKEFAMCIEQRVRAVGNTMEIKDKMLLIVTGANQGGKSTFLRSVGIAQIMMQAGLPVTAVKFKSGIFPNFFTHFTRREDSAMNSGRLDEELGRMSKIIDSLGARSLILLNESFATTTEKEGSVIAYDIIKALNEAGVKILTVTHLLSFAQKMFDENETAQAAGKETDITFFCAERLEDGKRTFKMIQHAPELTSFGLDLYQSLIVNGEAKR